MNGWLMGFARVEGARTLPDSQVLAEAKVPEDPHEPPQPGWRCLRHSTPEILTTLIVSLPITVSLAPPSPTAISLSLPLPRNVRCSAATALRSGVRGS